MSLFNLDKLRPGTEWGQPRGWGAFLAPLPPQLHLTSHLVLTATTGSLHATRNEREREKTLLQSEVKNRSLDGELSVFVKTLRPEHLGLFGCRLGHPPPGDPTQLYPLNCGLSPAEWDRRPRRIKARSYGNVLGAGAGPTQEANRGAAIITPITQTRETEAQ